MSLLIIRKIDESCNNLRYFILTSTRLIALVFVRREIVKIDVDEYNYIVVCINL